MMQQRIEAKWIDAFAQAFRLCGVQPGETAAILSETQSRPVNVRLAELALLDLGARVFHVVLPSQRLQAPVPVRSTGASDAIGALAPVVAALAGSGFVADLTVEGLLHAPELPQILAGGARVLMVSNEHPEVLERCVPDPALEPKVKAGMRLLKNARTMRVRSDAGTDLAIDLAQARVGGGWGYTARAGSIAHWPGGLCLAFPAAGSVDGRLVLDEGDVNLTFTCYLERPVALTVQGDHVTEITGRHLDAELMRSYFAGWRDNNAYSAAHVGFGLNTGARWDSMTMYDRGDHNGVEQRVFGGNFLYSTGANEFAGRYTLGHFDLPIRNCTIALDDEIVVRHGVLQGDLA